jgi:hypothetical protein
MNSKIIRLYKKIIYVCLQKNTPKQIFEQEDLFKGYKRVLFKVINYNINYEEKCILYAS